MHTRSMRFLRVVAVLVWCCGLAAFVSGMGRPDVFYPALGVFPGWGTIGMLLAVRRPSNPIGWLLLGMGSVVILTQIPGVRDQPPVLNGVFLAALAVVLVIFPTGRPTRSLWWAPVAMVGIGTVGSGVGVISAGGGEWPIGVVVAITGIVWCGAAPIVRFRHATGIERAQMRWPRMAVAISATGAILVVLGIVTSFEFAAGLGGVVAALGAGFGIPLSILLAVVRYRLYDIDRLISRTVTYAIVAGVVGATFAIPTVVIPELVGSSNTAVTAGATLAAAAIATPVRRHVQRRVDRRFNRSAFDAEREAEHLAGLLRDDSDVAGIRDQVATFAGRVLEPRSVALWVAARPATPRGAPTSRRG